MLKAMAPHLRQLRRLTLWGCTRVTKAGVFALLQESENLEELSIDALPHSVRRHIGSVRFGSFRCKRGIVVLRVLVVIV